MPKPEYEFFDPKDIPWEPYLEGVTQKILAKDPDTGDVTRLLRFVPGANTEEAGVMTHDFWEEIYIVEGDLHDLRLDESFYAGYYACRPPGMQHGPWRSETGVLMYETRYYR
jgi:hypothetical protein